MNAKPQKWVWSFTDRDKLNVAASVVATFLLVFLLAFVYFGDAPRELPALLATAMNVYFLYSAASESTKYVDLALSTFFFTFLAVMNVVL
jgi:hypothetical protein